MFILYWLQWLNNLINIYMLFYRNNHNNNNSHGIKYGLYLYFFNVPNAKLWEKSMSGGLCESLNRAFKILKCIKIILIIIHNNNIIARGKSIKWTRGSVPGVKYRRRRGRCGVRVTRRHLTAKDVGSGANAVAVVHQMARANATVRPKQNTRNVNNNKTRGR